MTTQTDANDKEFANEYTETRNEAAIDALTYGKFSGLTFTGDRTTSTQDAFDIEYMTTHGNRKSVRCLQGTRTTDRSVDKGAPVDAVTFWHDGDQYAFDYTTGDLYKQGDSFNFRKIADGDDVTVYHVELPPAAPVVGAVQDGVSVTVHYRSKRNGNMKTIRLDDVSVEWEGDRIKGYHARRDRRIEVEACYERKVETQGRRTQEVGKVARVEFPPGHTYTVDVEGVTDDHAEAVRDAIESAVGAKVGDDHDVDVTHDGRIDD